MHGWQRYILLCIIMTVLFPAAGTAVPAPRTGIARITQAQQPVEITSSERAMEQQAARGLSITAGDSLKTGNDGLCSFVFAGGSEAVLNQHSALLLKRGTLLSLAAGELWAHIRGERLITIETPAGQIHTLQSASEIIVSFDKEEQKTTIYLIAGTVELLNSCGSLQLGGPCKAEMIQTSAPQRTGELPDMAEFFGWVNTDNKTAALFINETLMGDRQESGVMRKGVERFLAANHFRILAGASGEDSQDPAMEALKKSASSGDYASARTLAQKKGAALIVMGRMETKSLGTVGSGIMSSGSRGEIKVFLTDTEDLLFSKIANATSIDRTTQKTGNDAAEKVMKDLSASLGSIIWEYNQSMAAQIPSPHTNIHVELIIQNCTEPERKAMGDKLRKRPDIHSITVKALKDRAVFILDTTATLQTLADYVRRQEKIEFQLLDMSRDKLIFRVIRKNSRRH